jgi:hypothetical protein
MFCGRLGRKGNVTQSPGGWKGWSILKTMRKPVLWLVGALALCSIVGGALLPADAEACGAKSDNNVYNCGNGTFYGCHFYDTTCQHVQGDTYVKNWCWAWEYGWVEVYGCQGEQSCSCPGDDSGSGGGSDGGSGPVACDDWDWTCSGGGGGAGS